MKTTFSDEVAGLKFKVGQRNALLMGLAMKGLGEGLTPAAVAEAILTADNGEPPLGEAEVSRAVSRAKEYMTGEANTNENRFRLGLRAMAKIQEGTSPEERGFVRRMIALGSRGIPEDATEADRFRILGRRLLDSSPVKIQSDCADGNAVRCNIPLRRRMAEAFVKTVFPDEEKYIFTTANVRLPRARERLAHPGELVCWLKNAEGICQNIFKTVNPKISYLPGRDPFKGFSPMPTHCGINEYSGDSIKTDKGELSYANKSTVANFGHLLIEFDALPLADQTAFWCGVVASGELPLLSLVWTTNKSIHGIVKVKEAAADGLFGETSREAKEQCWARQVKKIFRLCASDEEPRYRCDAACKDPTRMTRFPGGVNPTTMQPQMLLWCARPAS